jgi:hypothetical protein
LSRERQACNFNGRPDEEDDMSYYDDLTPVGEELLALLRPRAEAVIAKEGHEWAAGRLGIALSGVKSLLWKLEWGAGKTIAVASRLGVLTDDDLDRLRAPDPVPS